MYNILCDSCFVFAEHLRRSPNQIARELKKLAALRQLDTVAYTQSVNQRKQAARASKRKAAANPVSVVDQLIAEQLAHKKSNRSYKRKISKMAGQIKRLRKDLKEV